MAKNKKTYGSFQAAFDGLRETLIFEKSFKTMIIIAAFVVAAMFYFPTSRLEKVVLLLAILSVLILELINSAVERIMDVVTFEHDDRIRVIKDLMAAIVLLASFGAAIIGILIFLPYIRGFFISSFPLPL
jgi:diacylglycerol kinase